MILFYYGKSDEAMGAYLKDFTERTENYQHDIKSMNKQITLDKEKIRELTKELSYLRDQVKRYNRFLRLNPQFKCQYCDNKVRPSPSYSYPSALPASRARTPIEGISGSA